MKVWLRSAYSRRGLAWAGLTAALVGLVCWDQAFPKEMPEWNEPPMVETPPPQSPDVPRPPIPLPPPTPLPPAPQALLPFGEGGAPISPLAGADLPTPIVR